MHMCARQGVQADLDHLLSINEFELLQVFPEKFRSSPPLQQPQQAHLKTSKVALVKHTGSETQHRSKSTASKVQVQTWSPIHILAGSMCWSVDLPSHLSILMQ